MTLLLTLLSCSSSPVSLSYSQAITDISTPQEVDVYLEEYFRIHEQNVQRAFSFRLVHEVEKGGDCTEVMLTAAALLSDDGYPPRFISLRKRGEDYGHILYVYQKDQLWGTIDAGHFHSQRAHASVIEDLLAPYVTAGFDGYSLGEIPVTQFPNWIFTEEDLYVDAALFGIHRKYTSLP